MLQLDAHPLTPLHQELMRHERLHPFLPFVSIRKFSQINVLVHVCCETLTFQNFCLDVDTKAEIEVSD